MNSCCRRPPLYVYRTGGFLSLAALVACAASAALAADGAALIENTWAQYRAVKTEREKIDLLILPNPSPQVERSDVERMLAAPPAGATHKRAVRHVLYGAHGGDKIHVSFSLPHEDAGLGFLVWGAADKSPDDMWLFLPGYRSVRRVAVSTQQSLAGTDFSYEDVRLLAGERTELFQYTRGGAEQLDGRLCNVVVAQPKEGTTTVYARRKFWLDAERRFPNRVEFYDANDSLWKILRTADVHQVDGVWRADLMEMHDTRRNRSTWLLVSERAVGVAIRDAVFTQDYLMHPLEDE